MVGKCKVIKTDSPIILWVRGVVRVLAGMGPNHASDRFMILRERGVVATSLQVFSSIVNSLSPSFYSTVFRALPIEK